MGGVSNPPHRGQLIRDYELKKPDGSAFLLSDFRGKQNLVLVFIPGQIEPSHTYLLHQLAAKSGEVREDETRVIVVVRSGQLQTVAALSEELISLPTNPARHSSR